MKLVWMIKKQYVCQLYFADFMSAKLLQVIDLQWFFMNIRMGRAQCAHVLRRVLRHVFRNAERLFRIAAGGEGLCTCTGRLCVAAQGQKLCEAPGHGYPGALMGDGAADIQFSSLCRTFRRIRWPSAREQSRRISPPSFLPRREDRYMLIASQVMLRERSAVPSRLSRTVRAVLVGSGIALCGLSAQASRTVDEVAQLLDQGNAKQAAKQAESYLKQNPGDVEMRFMQGVIATEQKLNVQAIKIFSTLIRDYPNMPEPYNNLAVLYAADGQERKAAEALEQAIRTNPSYTTAHENLGDLYARMASEAYSKALQLDGSRKAIPAKLALITQLVPGQQTPAKTLVAAASTPAAAAPSVSRATQAEAKVEPKQEAKAEKKPEAVAVAPAQPAPKVDAKAPVKSTLAPAAVAAAVVAVAAAPEADAAKVEVKPAKPSAEQAAPAAKPAMAAKPAAAVSEVESAVHAWAAAWQKQDMPRYLNAYSEKFVPADGSSFDKWKEARRVRIVGKDNISVALQNLRVSVDGDQATAKFRQRYVAGSLNSTTRKTLALRQEKGAWRIVRESTGG